jgi:hypothetical protein
LKPAGQLLRCACRASAGLWKHHHPRRLWLPCGLLGFAPPKTLPVTSCVIQTHPKGGEANLYHPNSPQRRCRQIILPEPAARQRLVCWPLQRQAVRTKAQDRKTQVSTAGCTSSGQHSIVSSSSLHGGSCLRAEQTACMCAGIKRSGTLVQPVHAEVHLCNGCADMRPAGRTASAAGYPPPPGCMQGTLVLGSCRVLCCALESKPSAPLLPC